MTSREQAAAYLVGHLHEVRGAQPAVYNPDGKAVDELPAIYGFNNGGSPGWWSGVLLGADGAYLGGHICSDEGYMTHDLGVLEDSRPDRHETFRKHYPGGYRMEFVSHRDVPSHIGLTEAFRLNQLQHLPGGENE